MVFMRKQLIFLAVWGMCILVGAIFNRDPATAESNPFSVSGYGIIHYSHSDWELDPGRRAAIDIERFVIAPKYRINDTVRLESDQLPPRW